MKSTPSRKFLPDASSPLLRTPLLPPPLTPWSEKNSPVNKNLRSCRSNISNSSSPRKNLLLASLYEATNTPLHSFNNPKHDRIDNSPLLKTPCNAPPIIDDWCSENNSKVLEGVKEFSSRTIHDENNDNKENTCIYSIKQDIISMVSSPPSKSKKSRRNSEVSLIIEAITPDSNTSSKSRFSMFGDSDDEGSDLKGDNIVINGNTPECNKFFEDLVGLKDAQIAQKDAEIETLKARLLNLEMQIREDRIHYEKYVVTNKKQNPSPSPRITERNYKNKQVNESERSKVNFKHSDDDHHKKTYIVKDEHKLKKLEYITPNKIMDNGKSAKNIVSLATPYSLQSEYTHRSKVLSIYFGGNGNSTPLSSENVYKSQASSKSSASSNRIIRSNLSLFSPKNLDYNNSPVVQQQNFVTQMPLRNSPSLQEVVGKIKMQQIKIQSSLKDAKKQILRFNE